MMHNQSCENIDKYYCICVYKLVSGVEYIINALLIILFLQNKMEHIELTVICVISVL